MSSLKILKINGLWFIIQYNLRNTTPKASLNFLPFYNQSLDVWINKMEVGKQGKAIALRFSIFLTF